MRGTANGNWAVHNYEDRSFAEVIPHDELFLGHFDFTPRIKRNEEVPSADDVLGHFHERLIGLDEDQAKGEAERCMSCGMCFECDNCVIFCPQDAVYRVKKTEATTGRYVATDYSPLHRLPHLRGCLPDRLHQDGLWASKRQGPLWQ